MTNGSAPRRSLVPMAAAAVVFGALVLATPFIALPFRDQLQRGGLGSVFVLTGLTLFVFALSIGCLGLFLRASAGIFAKPDHSAIETFTSEPQQALMRAFDFDGDDLAANRDGRLSSRQRANLRAGRAVMLIIGAVMVGVTALSVTVMPLLIAGGESGPAAPGSLGRLGAWLPIGLIGLLVGGAFARAYWTHRDQLHGRLSVVEGEAGSTRRGAGPATMRGVGSVEVGGVAVPVLDPAQQAALRLGARYRVYYLRGPMPRVMAIEAR